MPRKSKQKSGLWLLFSLKKHAGRLDIFKEGLLNVKEHFLKVKNLLLNMKEQLLKMKDYLLKL